jgi:hypothetical protein
MADRVQHPLYSGISSSQTQRNGLDDFIIRESDALHFFNGAFTP